MTYVSKLLIPAYVYPGAPPRVEWNAWIAAEATRFIIANPATGPGTFTDTNYQAVIAQAQARGITILGYVDQNYGAVATGTVEANVDGWNTFYGIRDIFFDRVSSGAVGIPYVRTLANYVRAAHAGSKVVLNFGTTCDQGYAAIGDVLVTFEGTNTTYASYVADAWTHSYPPARFCHLVYNIPDTATMTSVAGTVISANIGYTYLADVNSYFALPTFFAAEAALFADAPGGGGYGAVMAPGFFKRYQPRYEVHESWRKMRRVKA